jgi:hypothetical protein
MAETQTFMLQRRRNKMHTQKKITAVALSIPLFLFMTSEQRAAPVFTRSPSEPQSAVESPASAIDNQTAPVQPNSTGMAAGGKKKSGAHRRRPRELARRPSRRKYVRSSAPALASRRLRILKREYARRTGRQLVITSFGRTPEAQARAIRHNLNAYGVRYVLSVYRGSAAIRQIVRTYKANRGHQPQAQREMARVIKAQVANGTYISDHMRGRAVDIRSRGREGARLTVLQNIAHEIGGSVFREIDHYHYKLV